MLRLTSLRYCHLAIGLAASLVSSLAFVGCSTNGVTPVSSGAVPVFSGAAVSRDGASRSVTSLNDSGAGTLRAAIDFANKRKAGSSVGITFAVNGTITLASNLPAIGKRVTIDGTSAPTYAAAGPVVELNANRHGGLVFGTGSKGSELLALAVDGAKNNGVTLDAGSITLNLNYIGLNLTGTASGNGGDGVYVTAQSSNNSIGLNAAQASGAVANVISGNKQNGVSLHGSSGNVIVTNRIGTNAAGTSAIANGANGILVTDASKNNEIGGTIYVDGATGKINDPTGQEGKVQPVFVVPPMGNLVSGNGRNGILIDAGSERTMLNGNFIGTTPDGDAAIGNARDGVRISSANDNTLAGCKVVNNPFVYYNVSSGNGGNGVHITDSNSATVQGNFFGIGADNTRIVANKGNGMLIDGTSRSTQVGGVIPLGNVSAGNALNGIEVAGKVANFITFNTFGGLLAFKGAAANGNDGLLITATGGGQLVRTNVFSGNTNNGIELAGDASGVTVDPVIVGLGTSGQSLLPNGNNGILIGGTAHGNLIGGYLPSVIPQNTISGNGGYGVAIAGRAHDNAVFNSFIGVGLLGGTAFPNKLGGVDVGGSANHNMIGGFSNDPSMPRKNLISGNTGNGVTLEAGSSHSGIIKNWIGLNRAGRNKLPNSGQPIVVMPGSLHNRIMGNSL